MCDAEPAGGNAMPDAYIVRHCSPTLAGLKTGNMFTVKQGKETTISDLRSVNRRITKYGLRLIPLRRTNETVLLYLYRPERLKQDLDRPDVQKILSEKGYDVGNCEQCVAEVARHLKHDAQFPHEIGLFLSYPPEDVQGFMDHPHSGVKAIGCWKVYGDRQKAEQTFRMYDACTAIYEKAASGGVSLEQLIVKERR